MLRLLSCAAVAVLWAFAVPAAHATIPSIPFPTAGTVVVSNLDDDTVTLSGSADLDGASAPTFTFMYGPGPAGSPYTVTTPPISAQPNASGFAAVSADVDGLSATTTYHARLVVSVGGLSWAGPDTTFTTTVAHVPVVALTGGTFADTWAVISQTIVPTESATTWWVEYGTTADLGSSSATAVLAAGDQASTRSVRLSDLLPDTTYYYRVVATNADGMAATAIRRLHTAAGAAGGTTAAVPSGVVAIEASVSRAVSSCLTVRRVSTAPGLSFSTRITATTPLLVRSSSITTTSVLTVDGRKLAAKTMRGTARVAASALAVGRHVVGLRSGKTTRRSVIVVKRCTA